MPWFTWCLNAKGRPVIYGPFLSDIRAQEYADNLVQDAEIKEAPNRVEAVKQLKAMLSEEYRDADRGMKRFVHRR